MVRKYIRSRPPAWRSFGVLAPAQSQNGLASAIGIHDEIGEIGMKKCAYCGRENDDSAASCTECGTEEFKAADHSGVLAKPWPPV
jgi:hypothetical protein